MLEDIAKDVLGGVLRGVVRGGFELVVELLLRGAGEAVLRCLRPHKEPTHGASVGVGVLVWVALGLAGWFLYRQLAVA